MGVAEEHMMPSAWLLRSLYFGLLVLAALGSQTEQSSLAFEELAPLVAPESEPTPSWLWTWVANLAPWMKGTPVRTRDASGTTDGLCTGASSGLAPSECTAWQNFFDDLSLSRGPADRQHLRDDPCSIRSGVGCDGGSITQIALDALGRTALSGTIPESILQLTALDNLILSDTSLSGSIPDSIGTLAALDTIDLFHTGLSGTIPNSIGHLTALIRLDLDRTSVSGTIPDIFGTLPALSKLDLHSTGLSGTIPDSFIHLDVPQATGYIDLHNTRLSGTIPESIAQLTGLEYLYLQKTALSGTIPESIGKLSTLEVLDLHNTSLIGTIPKTIGQLTSLGFLDLSFTSITGAIPDSFCALSALVDCNLTQTTTPACPLPNCPGVLKMCGISACN